MDNPEPNDPRPWCSACAEKSITTVVNQPMCAEHATQIHDAVDVLISRGFNVELISTAGIRACFGVSSGG